MDTETLYKMAKAATIGATNVLNAPSDKSKLFYERYAGYPTYINEYNKLLSLCIEIFGEEAKKLFQSINIGSRINPGNVPGMSWRTYSELAANRLSILTAYLEAKLGSGEKKIIEIKDLIISNLRSALFEQPTREKDVQGVLEIILRARGLDFQREIVRIEYSAKSFIPDFTFEALNLALEVKFCNSIESVRQIVEEINADIPAYQSRYRFVLFVLYDLGFIRDINQFKSGIERNTDVHVLIIKQ